MKKILVICLPLVLLLLLPITDVFATIGVGVGTGKIVVEDELKPGSVYRLPSISVINTGDEAGEYSIGIAYHQDQPEFEPPKSWFRFSPEVFSLEPQQLQVVDVTLDVPVNAIPGDYFAYIEAFPLSNSGEGSVTTIGIAAASKLYFEITPANVLAGVYYKAISLWKYYQPWSTRGAIVVGGVVTLLLMKKYLNIDINLKKKNED